MRRHHVNDNLQDFMFVEYLDETMPSVRGGNKIYLQNVCIATMFIISQFLI